MSTPTEQGPDEAFAALARLAEVIANPHRRQSFLDDPETTLAEQDPSRLIPQNVVAVLTGLSHDELVTLAHLRKTMIDAGVYVRHPSGYIACVL